MHNSTHVFRRVRRGALGIVALAALAGTTAACTSASGASTTSPSKKASSNAVTLNLVAYSTPKTAYSALISAFEKTKAGKNVTFTTSFGASGQQAKSVAAGLPADVVNFSDATDMNTLVKAGLVASNWWKQSPGNGMVTDSTVVFVVRKGNPDRIKTWADLVKSGTQVVTPNPFSSGSARWNLMAAYGSELRLGKTKKQADNYLDSLLKHTVSQPASASDALAAFEAGTGNVLLDYEDDAKAAVRAGAPVQYVVPEQTILIQNPIAVVKTSKHLTQAKAFVKFLLSKEGQELWAKQGYRPVLAGAAKAAGVHFPTPARLFTIDSLGGWTSVNAKFFSANGIVTKDESSLGVSTSSS